MLVQLRSSPANNNSQSTGSFNINVGSAMNSTPRRQRSAEGLTVICLYDYESNDRDHISFQKDDILTIVHQEPSGWWAAQVNGRVGWVPSAYVKPITATDQIPVERQHYSQHDGKSSNYRDRVGAPVYNGAIDPPIYSEEEDSYLSPTGGRLSSEYTEGPISPTQSPSLIPDHVISGLAESFAASSLRPSKASLSSSTQAIPNSSTMYSPASTSNYSKDSIYPSNFSPAYESATPHQLSLVIEEGSEVNSQWSMPSLDNSHKLSQSTDNIRLASPSVSVASTTSNTASLLQRTQLAYANLPTHLRPKHAWDELKLDSEGLVVGGTVPALIERLTVDTPNPVQEQVYRTAFLNTFKSFTTSNTVFDALLNHYNMEQPLSLAPSEVIEWKENKLRPTQTRVFAVFTQWVEKHWMSIDDPQLIPRLRGFLTAIVGTPMNVQRANQLLQVVEKQQIDDLNRSFVPSTSPTSGFLMRRKIKTPKQEFLKWDPAEVANHLTLMEYRAYLKIRPHECLSWIRTTKGPAVSNLTTFIATSDQLAAWVKFSVLMCDTLGKRADTIDHWIKIAERCRSMNNFFSMSAIVAALSSGDVGKLHLTWASVSRGSTLEQMVKITDPTGKFATYRLLHNTIDTACIPFISIFLTDLVHINDQFPDVLPAPSGPVPDERPPRPLINFMKLQRLSDVISSIVKFYDKQYRHITENPNMMSIIEQQISIAASKDKGFFWQRSQELQTAEVTHADIWKNLNDAGF